MKGMWKKRLSAFLLTLALTASLIPAAAAEEHHYASAWSSDGSYHWHVCTDQDCDARGDYESHDFGATVTTKSPTCFQPGEGYQECAVCKYKKTVSIPATNAHKAASGWTWDTAKHWHACTATSGCPQHLSEASHTFTSGEYSNNSSFHWQICTICGGTSAKAAHTDANGDGVCDVCHRGGMPVTNRITVTFMNGSSTYRTQTITKGSTPSNPGTPSKSESGKTYSFVGWSTSNPGSSAIYDRQSYKSSSQVASTALSANTTYYALYNVRSNNTITYSAKAGKSVSFDRSDFRDVYENEFSSGSLRWVEFETDDTLSSSRGTIYYDYGGSNEQAFSRSSLEDERFYYSSGDGDYDLNNLSFVAGDESRTVTLDFRACYSSSKYAEGTLIIEVKGGSSSSHTITYKVDTDDVVEFDRRDFNNVFQQEYSNYTVKYVTFETDDTLSSSRGTVYYDYKGSDEKSFSASGLEDERFYYSSSDGDYDLNSLSFVSGSSERTVTLDFRAYYSSSRYVDGTVKILVGDSADDSDITYEVDPGKKVSFDRDDFNDFFQKKYKDYDIRFVTFETDDTLSSSKSGLVYFDYDGKDKKSFSDSTIDDYEFYYKDSDYGKYALDKLSFVAGDNFDKAVKLHFTAYYSSSRHVEGTLVINPSGTSKTGGSQGDIRYYAAYTTNVQINANDIARFFSKKYPTSTLQYVTLKDVPSTGSLYYNYYGVSKYGASKLKLTSSNCGNYNLYFSPSSTSQYALTELTYLPSGTNYCAQIPFTAYGSGSKSLSGTILISVNLSAVSEVYGVTPKGTAVTFPASAMYIAVSSASGQGLSSIQLLELPDSSVGTIYVGTGTSTKANTSTRYGYSSGSQRMGQLRFVPASGFTGSVEIPYVACNSSGTPIAAGKFSLGVVSNVKKFSDMTSSTWCYKYVVELSDAGVIDGYTDGSFKPNNTVTYGAALKLIMLAAGYPEQKPTDSNPFSGYLAKARSEGIITRSNVNLSAPITRLQVAQIAAGALKLDTTNLSSVQPFTDTTDPSVQALNAAGIVEGYFSGGKSTYKPNNTLTRGQVSAIVWRMEQLAD